MTDRLRPVRRGRTPQAILNAYAEVCRIIGGRAVEVFEVVRRAADEGPELADLWEAMQRNRRGSHHGDRSHRGP
ncbi:hypothetical protein [Streptomyces sp. SLBN-31]|uniref:hypothetical protein n=1 Tax=Streptomyces sp. SLBN-31 TaxID=2768444 RepID=UPI001150EA1D|nr:hypothetical protein [Streptomyces sp. SLBN-31]